ncbi:MAG: dicarboxylate/amino acid:cation symporter [Pseudomonadota bacterium]
MGWTKITLWKRVIIGLVLGLILGLALRYGMGPGPGGEGFASVAFGETWLFPFGDAFVRLIKMLVVPLIFVTLVSGVTAMGDPAKIGGLGARTIGLYMVTTFFAVALGLAMGTIFQPGVGVEFETASSGAVDSVTQRLEAGAAAADASFLTKLFDIIPANIVRAMATGDTGIVLQIIFFAILFGISCLLAGEAARPVVKVVESATEVMLKMTVMIMELAPIGVFFLMAFVMATRGLGVLDNLGLLAIALYSACFLHMIFVHGLLIVKGILNLPLARFFGGIRDAQAVAFSTASSAGTLPVTITNVTENLGVKKSVAASVLPVGATINMDGTAIYLGIVALFAAQAIGIDLTPGMYVSVALAATLTSIGAAAIPSAGLLLAAAVLSVIGVSEEQSVLIIAFIFPFDRLLDMMRTVTNVTGDAAVASAVAKWEGELNEHVFREQAAV